MATKQESVVIGVLQDQMKNVQDDVKDIKTDMKIGFTHIEFKIDELDKKFAAKWVQTLVAGLVAAILLGFIGVVIAFFVHPSSNNPTTSETTTTTTPTGSTATTSTKDNPSGTPSATANATAQSTPDKPTDSQTSNSNGGVQVTLPKVP